MQDYLLDIRFQANLYCCVDLKYPQLKQLKLMQYIQAIQIPKQSVSAEKKLTKIFS